MNPYLSKLFSLKNKNIVIIGAGGHICSQIAESLAKCESNLALLDIRYSKLKVLKEKLNKLSDKEILLYKFDATKLNQHKLVLKKILKKFKNIDVLINGAGINSSISFFDITEKNWKDVVDSQLNATFYGCQVFGKHMISNNKGSIINISSASASPPLSKAFAYSAAKSGIKNLTANLGREWGDKGVRVNALRPGFFPTKWNIENFIDNKRKKSIMNHTPMSRFGKTNELSGAVIWLCSSASSFVTGSEVYVDGGFSCMTI